MISKVVALLEGLSRADVEAPPPAQRERFAALCRHWAAAAELRREVPKTGVLSRLKSGERAE